LLAAPHALLVALVAAARFHRLHRRRRRIAIRSRSPEIVQERIDKIESELELVRRQRETQRAGRQRSDWPLASIVGYTNAGKSTLLNKLTGAAVLAEDKLFATLDPDDAGG
jgi:50S ribosomal subunit-associated GTPase HflX